MRKDKWAICSRMQLLKFHFFSVQVGRVASRGGKSADDPGEDFHFHHLNVEIRNELKAVIDREAFE
jgi:hypothetical protein